MFRSAPFQWWIVGGWAIDLFIGRQTRAHEDIEIAILRRDQAELRRWMRGWELWYVPAAGKGLARWSDGERLAPDQHEIWSRQEGHAEWQLEVLLEEADGDRWTYRRDSRVSAALRDLGHEVDGTPVIRPEIALLYKSKGARERDQADFEMILPVLSGPARRWLRDALEVTGTRADWVGALRP